MNKHELQEIEKQAEEETNDRKKVPYNKFAEYCLDLIAEVKRQREYIDIGRRSYERLKDENKRLKKQINITNQALEAIESEGN